ncbi:uncharacterized protein LOC135693321 [Rhopilema esculentum]|uniref:uncharacterized protein LOC135693321 n=1 Tax=Rhopilema esculentum TaxID=499914 RepID=UPI0031DB4B89|eukprot:gene10580-19315_t
MERIKENKDKLKGSKRHRKLSIVEIIEGPRRYKREMLRALRKDALKGKTESSLDVKNTEKKMAEADKETGQNKKEGQLKDKAEKKLVSKGCELVEETGSTEENKLLSSAAMTGKSHAEMVSLYTKKQIPHAENPEFLKEEDTCEKSSQQVDYSVELKEEREGGLQTRSRTLRENRRRRWSHSLKQLLQEDDERKANLEARFLSRKLSSSETSNILYGNVDLRNTHSLDDLEIELGKLQANIFKFNDEILEIKARLEGFILHTNEIATQDNA